MFLLLIYDDFLPRFLRGLKSFRATSNEFSLFFQVFASAKLLLHIMFAHRFSGGPELRKIREKVKSAAQDLLPNLHFEFEATIIHKTDCNGVSALLCRKPESQTTYNFIKREKQYSEFARENFW